MKFFNKITALFLSTLLLAASAGCAGKPAESSQQPVISESQSSETPIEKPKLRIGAIKGPTGLGLLQVMEKNDADEADNQYEFTVVGSPDEIVSKLTTGELDAAAVPTNLAATLYNKTEGEIQLTAINTLGVLYLVTNGEEIADIADLKGKTIYSSGQGAAPEYALNYILSANGLTDDVKVEYLSEHAELASQVIAGKISIAVLPEPFVTQVTTKNEQVKVALDLTKEWDKAVALNKDGSSVLTMGSLVVRRDFAQENEEAFDHFLAEYRASVDYVNKNPEKAAALSEKYDIMAAAVAEKAIPNCNIVFIDGTEMKAKAADFLKILHGYNPKSVGGTLPKDDFYYIYTG